MEFEQHLERYLSKDEIKKLVDALESAPKFGVLLNTEKMSTNEFTSFFPNVKPHPIVKNAYIYDKLQYPLGKSYLHDTGCYYLQEPSAMLVSTLLNPTKEDIVLDMCAAPGGKTIQASLLMKNEGIIISNDLSYVRAKALSSNVERMGRKNVVVTSMDMHHFPKKLHNTFTKIILDAPCSGSGMFRKDKNVENDWTYEKVLKCASIQKELIEIAYSLLAPGGDIIYSTCSFSFEEDEEVIKQFLSNHADISVIPFETNQFFYESEPKMGIHLFPSLFDGEGHYICLMHKDGNLNKKSFNLENTKKNIQELLNHHNLNDNYGFVYNNTIYALPIKFPLDNMTILRPGLKIGTIENGNFIPDHALSHYYSSQNSLPLNTKQFEKYIHGDIFEYQFKDGWNIVSYKGINLGYVKIVNNIAKNHYPKGLRR